MTHEDLEEIQNKMDKKSLTKRARDHSQPNDENDGLISFSNSKQRILTKDNLQKLDGRSSEMLRRLEDDNLSLTSQHSIDIRGLLLDLNLPLNLF